MPTIRIDSKTGFAYIPIDLRKKEGFVGDLEVLTNAITLTLLKPGITLEEAKKSLKIVIQDLDLKIEHRNREKEEGIT